MTGGSSSKKYKRLYEIWKYDQKDGHGENKSLAICRFENQESANLF